MFKKNIGYIGLILGMAIFVSCQKSDDYKKYLVGGEKVYPDGATKLEVFPGNGRILLKWARGIDARIKKYKIVWNNKTDSVEFDAAAFKPGDTVKHLLENMAEANYTFSVFSIDDKGNKSVPVLVPSVNVYGVKYQATLLNRTVKAATYSESDKGLTLVWKKPDTVNLSTSIWYTNLIGTQTKLVLPPNIDTTKIADWKMGTKLFYQSIYKPRTMAIDSFAVLTKDSLSVQNLPLSKALWKKVNLPNDVDGNAYGTTFASIWDGQAGGYPNIYHTQGGSLPHHFTIDLGAKYQLTRFEEIGRTGCACHNPVKFEVWGIADITNAATTLPGNDAGWKAESIAKGWTLLKEVERSDDGMAPFKVNLLEGIPAVRYIRIRVTKTLDDSIESHMSEISFWYNP